MPSTFFREKVLLGKKEALYGVQETLTGLANAVLTRDLKIDPIKGDTEERTYDNGGIGHGVLGRTSKHSGTSFKTDFAGSGTPGTAPAWGFLMLACGFSETVVEDESVSYAFTKTPDSLTLAYRNARNLHPGIGSRGMAKIDMTPKKSPVLDFSFESLWVAPSDAAFPVVNQSAWQKPQPVNFGNTTSVTLFGYEVALAACSLDFGTKPEVLNMPGVNLVDIVGHAPTANITILDPGIAAKNYYALAADENGALGDFELIHGVGAGSILTLASPELTQITNLQVVEVQGRTGLSMTLRFVDGPDGVCDFSITNT